MYTQMQTTEHGALGERMKRLLGRHHRENGVLWLGKRSRSQVVLWLCLMSFLMELHSHFLSNFQSTALKTRCTLTNALI